MFALVVKVLSLSILLKTNHQVVFKLNETEKTNILFGAKEWFKEIIVINHIKNTNGLIKAKEFNINPFLVKYLANFYAGDLTPKSLAAALVLPRVLGSSITTSFGQNLQKFTSNVLGAYASATKGIDIEFIDAKDGRKKYCQVKVGPNTINADDVQTIDGHFKTIKNKSRVDALDIGLNDLVVGVLYGENSELSGHYKSITNDYHYPVYCGKEFWLRLTGDELFYLELANAFAEVASDVDCKKLLEDTIEKLSNDPDIIKMST